MTNTNEYILILIYISTIKKDDTKILYRVYKEIHLINNLKAYILLKNNIINTKKIIFNIT